MFITEDRDGATFSASLAPDADPARPTEVWFCASRTGVDVSERIYVALTAADARGLAAELAAMADEIDTARLEAETAAADKECWYEWRTTGGHLTACAEPRYHEGPHRDAIGHSPEPRPRRQIGAEL